ncbi:unnamed protein product [Rotaria sordida]|uniref:Uncharacterized protein n=1 Tax=Rotaria sordida TaxID=392033 RepID=A0A815KSA1_9BILA|nr:unnamed protein product [Rotaria sordida]
MSLLIRGISCITIRRFTSTIGSNPQGIQDDPSLVANFIPDFTFPQGLQGDLSKGNGNDAICNLWLQKCKLYGYDNCEERLQKLLDTNLIEKT